MRFFPTDDGIWCSPTNRRDFLLTSSRAFLAGLVADMVPLWLGNALASTAEGRLRGPRFLMLRTSGGMDVTLGLDPQVLPPGATESDIYLEYRPEEILTAEKLKLGPAAAPLLPFAKNCVAVNGIMMRRDAGHEVLNLYLASGRGDGKATSLPAELATALGTAPFGLLMNGGLYLAGKAVLLSSTSELSDVAGTQELVKLVESKIKHSLPADTPLVEAQKAVAAAQEKTRELARLLDDFKKEDGTLTDYHVMVAALATGAVSQGFLEISANAFLDTHANHRGNHLTAQKTIWERVATVLKLLRRTGELDRTLVMVYSEFSRTPFLNAARGKDHNPLTNSVLLAGAGLRGGTTVGASRVITRAQSKTGVPMHYAAPFDYHGGKLASSPQGASFFYPENLIRTLLKAYGDPVTFNAVSYGTPLIPHIFRD